MKVFVENELAMERLGARIADACTQGALIFLHGDLGAGKTTLVRGLLRRLGHQGKVKSPTYTLIEEYDVNDRHVYHLDLYRLTDAEELDYLGLREVTDSRTICLIEWPENGAEDYFKADLTLQITYDKSGRDVKIVENTLVGKKMADLLKN